MTFELKHVGKKTILFVMAADAEYGPHLRARIAPLMTGIGPVESAICLTRILGKLEQHHGLPDLIVTLGSAGSRLLPQTEVFQVTTVSYRDMDASPLGFEKGRTPFLDLPAKVEMPLTVPGLPEATLSTGGNIVSGAAYDTIDADMVDMETFALLRVCHLFERPLIGLRGISDGQEELMHIGNWTEYLHVIDHKLGLAVDSLIAAVESGGLPI